MSVSGMSNYRFADTTLNKEYTTNCSIIIDDAIGITPKMQEITMYYLLIAVTQGCGIAVNTNNFNFKASHIKSDGEYIEGQNTLCDINLILEHISSNKSYPKFVSTVIKDIDPSSRGLNLTLAINAFANSLSYGTQSPTFYQNYRVKCANIFLHLGSGETPTPIPPDPPEPTYDNLYNKDTDNIGWRIDIDAHAVTDENYEISQLIPVIPGETYMVESKTVDSSDSAFVIASGRPEVGPTTGITITGVLQHRLAQAITTISFSVTIPQDVYYVLISVKRTNTDTLFALPVANTNNEEVTEVEQ